MDLYPAIDLRDGRCVRLLRGDYDAETVYGDDPVAMARGFEAAGSPWVHVVDLDAARSGEAANLAAISAICAAVAVPVQSGGGVRSVEAAERLFGVGVTRVVVGTAAVQRPALVDELCARFPSRVAVGLDARGRDIAVKGWTESSGLDLLELALRFDGAGVAALVVTEIGRDGTMDGPDLAQLGDVLGACSLEVIASGGVGSLDDLRALAGLRIGSRALSGAIAGRAIYEGRFSVAEGVAACSR